MQLVDIIAEFLREHVIFAHTLLAVGVVLASFLVRAAMLLVMRRNWERLSGLRVTEENEQLRRSLERPLSASILSAGAYLAVISVGPAQEVEEIARRMISVLAIVLFAWFLWRLTDLFARFLEVRARQKARSNIVEQFIPLIDRSSKVLVVLLGTLMIMENLGFSVAGILASIGIGGLALALSAQKFISDLFGSFMLLADRPFVVGDWIRSPDGSLEGGVERIGFRSTRIRTFDETLVIVPNSRLAGFVIDNVQRRPARRVSIKIRLSLHSARDDVRRSVERITALLDSHADVRKEPLPFHGGMTPLVRFSDFGDYALEVMVYYFTRPTEWPEYLRIREEINLKIMGILEDLQLSISYPTHAINVDVDAPVRSLAS